MGNVQAGFSRRLLIIIGGISMFPLNRTTSKECRMPVSKGKYELLKNGLDFGLALAAILFTLVLWLCTRPGVFYSGDAGLKFLMTAQFASGSLHPDLRLSAPYWVQALWGSGLYPFESPYVYALANSVYIQYPLWFSVVSVPGFVLAGYTGLYFLPLLGFWVVVICMVWTCRKLGLSPQVRCLAIVALAFGSPLPLYSAMFWEHTVGVSLAFSGFAWLVTSDSANSSGSRGLLAGLSVGFAAWFRSELGLFAIIILALAWTVGRVVLDRDTKRSFTIGVIVALGALMTTNLLLYGHVLGLHGVQVGFDVGRRISGALVVLSRLFVLASLHFPLFFCVLGMGWYASAFHANAITPRVALLLLSAAIFALFVPFVLPGPEMAGHGGKQWGPRFLLITVPLLCVGGAVVSQSLWRRAGKFTRVVLFILCTVGLAIGFAQNVVSGFMDLKEDYSGRVSPALMVVQSSRYELVAVSNQFIAQELASAMGKKSFVLARNGIELDAIITAAARAGAGGLSFLSDSNVRIPGARLAEAGSQQCVANISLLGVYGSYAVHEVAISCR